MNIKGTQKMPTKFKESVNVYNKQTKKVSGQIHYYMKQTSTEELLSAYNNTNTRGPTRAKIRNELVARKVAH
jgi:methionyl-tRNA synthetase